MREAARRALKLLDLTDLSDATSEDAIADLCRKARTPHGPVAAVCIWPRFLPQAREALQGSPVRLATVVNFPSGEGDVASVLDETRGALAEGAHEIDLVLPYRAFLRGDERAAAAMVEAVREAVGPRRTLKVILETGVLRSEDAIEKASRLAVEVGADFLKTSTGKTAVSATPEAARIMLGVIKDASRPVGLKPSGGIRSVADAQTYLDLADRIMGPEWATPERFRIGASGLYDVLVSAIAGRADATSAAY